jgi:hypothetical protein
LDLYSVNFGVVQRGDLEKTGNKILVWGKQTPHGGWELQKRIKEIRYSKLEIRNPGGENKSLRVGEIE